MTTKTLPAAIIASVLLVLVGIAPARAASTPPPVPTDPAPAECQPWIDVLDWRIDELHRGGEFLIRTEDQLFSVIRSQRDQIMRLEDRLQMRRWKIRQQARDLRRDARTIRHLRAEVRALQER
jgi:Spy/CpxP family protein refolding chaperone